MLKIDKQTFDELPDYTYLGCSEAGLWALVFQMCPRCGSTCDKSHSGIIEFCCGHSFDPYEFHILGLTYAGVVFSVNDCPAFMFTENT